MTAPVHQYPQKLEEIESILAETLIETKLLRPSVAWEIAEKAVERMRLRFGGELLYFPVGTGYIIGRRNAEIRRRIGAGEDPNAVRRAFNVSDTHLRRILSDPAPAPKRRRSDL